MLTLADVKDWLKGFQVGEHFYCGKIDSKPEKTIGVYQRKPSGQPRVALGGLENTSYEVKQISVLVHWNQYSSQTEEAAASLYEKIQLAKRVLLSGIHGCFSSAWRFRSQWIWEPMRTAYTSGSSGLI